MLSHFRNQASKIYSLVFSILVLTLLISFVSLSKFDLSTIATDFRWRKNLIDFYTSLRLNMGDKVYNNGVIGKGGWFFYTGEISIPDYQNTAPLQTGRLAKLQKNLDRLNMDLRKKSITLLVVIPPNKSTIYPQNMPAQIPVIGNPSRLDQLLEYMKLHGDTTILDLRPTLFEASRSQDVYYKTDTHWNDVGAYYAYVEIMRTLALHYPLLTPHPISDFKYTYTGDSIRDLPSLMGLSSYAEENWVLVPNFDIQLEEAKIVLPDERNIRTIINANKQLPNLLVFSDSYYGSLSHFIEPHFSRVKTIPFSNEDGVWSLDWIRREDPDIVVIELVERYFDIGLQILLRN